jgi:hypothetical protein
MFHFWKIIKVIKLIKGPGGLSVERSIDAKGSILFLFMHLFTAFVQLDTDPLKYILSKT